MIVAGVAALALVVTDILIRAFRLRTLLGDAWDGNLRVAVAVNAYGDAASAVTPARLGGEPTRFLALRRRDVPGPATAAALATERVVDMGLAFLVALAAAGMLAARGFGDLRVLGERFMSPRVVPWLVAVLVLIAVSASVAVRLRHRFPRAVKESLREAITHLRTIAGARLVTAIGLTMVSMAARVAILPILLGGAGVLDDPVTAVVGSFALLYAQLLLPTPAGSGGVELAFVVGLGPELAASQVAALLITWRVLTLILPAGLGLGFWLAAKKSKRELHG